MYNTWKKSNILHLGAFIAVFLLTLYIVYIFICVDMDMSCIISEIKYSYLLSYLISKIVAQYASNNALWNVVTRYAPDGDYQINIIINKSINSFVLRGILDACGEIVNIFVKYIVKDLNMTK